MNELRLEVPRLNPLPFIIADLVLLATAALVGWQAPAPLGTAALAAISLCVAVGAVVLLYPFVVNHARRQDEALQDRADQIEALTRSVSTSAEQISIAVASLPAIAENSARQIKAAEQLPAALEAQLAGLQDRLSTEADEENTALRRELATLREELSSLREELSSVRAAESTALSAARTELARATVDLARVEKLVTERASSLDQALAQLPRLADVIEHKAGEALHRESAATLTAVRTALAEAGAALQASHAESQVTLERILREALAQPAQLAQPALREAPPPSAPASSPTAIPPPARHAPADLVFAPAPVAPPAPVRSEAPAPATTLIDDAALDEPPAAEPPADSTEAEAQEDSEAAALPADLAADTPTDPDLDLETTPSAPAEPALSNDGYTRLIATAYIGIGNKLYIRGEGPGLRRDKGVPLQFVSIGKWRWESAELLFPVTARLYKNDQIECTALGEITLEPGHHHEVQATF
jgi:hypothetical protein